MGERLVTIRTYSYPWEADHARAILEVEGVPAFVADNQLLRMNWLLSNAVGGVKLQVVESHAIEALEILSQIEEHRPQVEEDEEDKVICPNCGSSTTVVVRLGRRWSFLTWLLVGVPLIWPLKRQRCQDCGETWKPKKT